LRITIQLASEIAAASVSLAARAGLAGVVAEVEPRWNRGGTEVGPRWKVMLSRVKEENEKKQTKKKE